MREPPPHHNAFIVANDDDVTPTGEWILRHPSLQDLELDRRVGLAITGRAAPIVDAVIVGRTADGLPTASPVHCADVVTPEIARELADLLAPARGVVLCVVFGGALWAVLAACVWALWRAVTQ